jgi:signal transduction histidine kinase
MCPGQAHYLDAFVKTAQYLAGLTTQQNVWSETGRLLVSFWGADLGGFGERRSDGEVVIRHRTLSADLPNRMDFASEIQEDIAEVLNSGFLTWRSISSAPEPLLVAFLPITQENQVTRVLLAGHRTSGSLPKELLNTYLALAGLVGTTAERLASEAELRKHRQHLEELVAERTAQLTKTNEQLKHEIIHRQQAEEVLLEARNNLEVRVQERTAELVKTNSELEEQIAQRKKAEAVLKQTLADLTRSNEDLQQFAYVASHDLQEPLRNVASCVQLLEKNYKGKLDDDADQYIRYAIDGAVRMKALIQDLLYYSRIATRWKPRVLIDCEEILDLTAKNLSSAITEAGAVITHDPLPTVSGDDTQLLQVMQNLIANAIKFRSHEPPTVHVSAVRNGNEWVFSVKDNGIGIESQHLDRIFMIFQRLHKRSQYDGTGMGLAIVKKVVERHGGRVWVESEPGNGATFYFTIPAPEMRK